MARKNPSRVFFPWEKKRGLLGLASRARTRLVLGIALGLGFLLFLHRREEHAAAVRATRAAITNAAHAVEAYRADHSGKCPGELAELVRGGYAHDPPVDAWGRPLRLACPGRRDPRGFDISSDGPDGVYGGLDRVE